MIKKPTVSISIVTRSRLDKLEQCLTSLLNQKILPDEVLVIDNDPAKSALNIAKKDEFASLNIQYINCSGSVPKCRNRAINLASSEYLGFIDDDCVVDKHWVKIAKKIILQSHPNVILGKTHLLNATNIWAIAQHSRDSYWKDYNNQLFDTKNALVNLSEIKKNKLHFDEKCQFQWYDSADFDFDFQLKKQLWKRTYCKSMIVFHQETAHFDRFKKRAFARGYLAKYLDRKWHLKDALVDRSTRFYLVWLLKMIKSFKLDFMRYSTEMVDQTIFKKLFAIFVIKLFERYYVEGYESNT